MNELYLIWKKNKLVIKDGYSYLDSKKINIGKYKDHYLPDLGFIKLFKNNNELIIITDTINSVEIFVTFKENKICLSDEPINIRINKNNLLEFKNLGYCINEKTIFENTILLPCSSKIKINLKDLSDYKIEYLKYFNNIDYNYKKTLFALNELVKNKISLLKQYDKVVLFLSSGYDSRLVLNLIGKYKMNNFYIAVFGSKYSEETIRAIKYAQKTNLKLINLSHGLNINKKTQKRKEYLNFINKFNFTYTPNLDFFSACFEIKEKFSKDKILCLNGNSGDFADGRQEMKNYKKFNYKFSIYGDDLSKKVNFNKSNASKFSQEFNHINRQSKYTISPRHCYEYFGFDHWHLLWERKYLETIFSDKEFSKRRLITKKCLENENYFNLDLIRIPNKPYLNKLKHLYLINRLVSKYVFFERLNFIYYYSNYSHVYQLFTLVKFIKSVFFKKIKNQSRGCLILIHNSIIKKILN